MFVWKGHGYLGFLLPIAAMIGFQDAFPEYYATRHWINGIIVGLSALPVGVIGYLLNKKVSDKLLMDPKTGKEVAIRGEKHSAFFIPLEYFSFALILFGIAGYVNPD